LRSVEPVTRSSRAVHAAIFVVATFAIALQLVLVWRGHSVLDESQRPDLGTRLVRFVSYFTILSNLLVAVTEAMLAAGRWHSETFRVLRVNAVTGIAVTGVIHWFVLRPLLDLQGSDALADALLHRVVPVLAVAGWLAIGPRGLLDRQVLARSAIFPTLYLVWTLGHGAATDWYPYPFVDVTVHGYPVVLLNALAVVAFLVALSLGAAALDRRLPPRAPRS
jgi:hypothetical protein